MILTESAQYNGNSSMALRDYLKLLRRNSLHCYTGNRCVKVSVHDDTLNVCTVHWWGEKCSIPARALMRERSKRRAELFSLSQSVSAARSQRLLMSLYCCWISKLSKSVGEMVLMVSRLKENTFNLEFGHGETQASVRERRGHNAKKFHKTCFGTHALEDSV